MTRLKKMSLLRGGAVLAALAVAGVFATRFFAGHKIDPKLTAPVLAIRRIQSKPVFYTPAAREFLVSLRPDLLVPDDKRFAEALQNPALFRQIDRREHFDTVLLAGDLNPFRPLLKHLLETQDFSLVYLDHASLLFRRAPVRKWSPDDFEAIRANFSGEPAWEEAEFLAQAAGRLLAVNEPALAKRCLDEALEKDNKSVAAWTQAGYYAERLAHWDEALTDADTALAVQADYQPAMVLRAQALFATKRFDAAYDVTGTLVEQAPKDPSILFLHARVAHQDHAYVSEIAALKALIDLAEKQGQPLSGYRIYLGQAYASAGQAQPSVDVFEKVLEDPAISADQRAYVRESIARIRGRVGGLR